MGAKSPSERIYTAAAESVAASGLDRLNIDDIAACAGCSRATVYRHVGGKGAIRDAVLARSIGRIVTTVEAAVAQLAGQERVVKAILVSLDAIRSDPIAAGLTAVPTADNVNRSLTGSPRLAGAAAELAGLEPDDPLAPEWIVRVVLLLLYWPIGDREMEEVVVRRFATPAFS